MRYVAKACLELLMLLPPPLKCQDCKHMGPYRWPLHTSLQRAFFLHILSFSLEWGDWHSDAGLMMILWVLTTSPVPSSQQTRTGGSEACDFLFVLPTALCLLLLFSSAPRILVLIYVSFSFESICHYTKKILEKKSCITFCRFSEFSPLSFRTMNSQDYRKMRDAKLAIG